MLPPHSKAETGIYSQAPDSAASPIHRAVWEATLPVEDFLAANDSAMGLAREVMDRCVALVLRHRENQTLHDGNGKVTPEVIGELSAAGYFGLLVPQKYGGSECSFRSFTAFVTRMAAIDATVAGLAAVHGCIGAVDSLRCFGSDEQQERFLPALARGERLSAFAMTEPAAGSDLTALRTHAVRRGDQFLVTGEKLFVTNLELGRTIALVCIVDGQPAILIVDLPAAESESFQLINYGLHALQHSVNRGVRFKNFPVPASNLLQSSHGNGLTIAYHGLNLGRVALCANAAGVMRRMLAGMLPWGKFRTTYGASIDQRELVQRRFGRLASLIVAADSTVAWCATLHDRGLRGELEGIVAKSLGSEALKEAAIELCLKTHGGRAFLKGHYWGDHIHDFLAPAIYEGEGELLSLAFFRTLVKQHSKNLFVPLAQRINGLHVKRFNPLSPGHWLVMHREAWPYMRWFIGERIGRKTSRGMPREFDQEPRLRRHAEFAIEELQKMALVLDDALQQHQLQTAQRQCRMGVLSSRIQLLAVSLGTALAGMQTQDDLTRRAAEIFCWDVHQKLLNRPPDDRFFQAITELGADLAAGNWSALAGVPAADIMMPYDR